MASLKTIKRWVRDPHCKRTVFSAVHLFTLGGYSHCRQLYRHKRARLGHIVLWHLDSTYYYGKFVQRIHRKFPDVYQSLLRIRPTRWFSQRKWSFMRSGQLVLQKICRTVWYRWPRLMVVSKTFIWLIVWCLHSVLYQSETRTVEVTQCKKMNF